LYSALSDDEVSVDIEVLRPCEQTIIFSIVCGWPDKQSRADIPGRVGRMVKQPVSAADFCEERFDRCKAGWHALDAYRSGQARP
ncbi:hypothetical protein, partial [Pseudomonas viridiflava]|uniref:hypothetical protein n=2 Tax=Pseudomonas viridiflava TaxID=33069 RepID=UPI001980526F